MKKKILIFVLVLLNLTPLLMGQDEFFFDEETEENAAALTWGGQTRWSLRYNIQSDTPGESPVENLPELKLTMGFDKEGSEFKGVLKLGEENITNMVDEAWLRLYLGAFDLEAGLMKVVWGKGDGVHVLDLLNATDYRDFINRDYIDRRIAVPMVKLNLALGLSTLLEGAYIPIITPDAYPLTGQWVPLQIQAVLNQTYQNLYNSYYAVNSGALPAAAAAELSASQAAAAMAAMDLNDYMEDLSLINSGQYALRLTTTVNSLDLGFQYYYGFVKMPVMDLTDMTIAFNRLHSLGMDAAMVAGPFNLRGELALNITKDWEGDDADIYNSSLEYVGGFDINLGVNNMNLNAQATGKFVLNSDGIVSGDMEFQSDGVYHSNTLAINLSDTYNYEKVKVNLTGAYNFEDQDWFAQPSVEISLMDDMNLEISYKMFEGDADTNFGQFDDNDFGEVIFTYSF